MSSPSKLRVIQWATGGVGKAAIECVLNHPQLKLVGCWVHSADKNGRDVGEILGTAALGVAATSSVDEVLATDADCVVYSPLVPNDDEVIAILRSGKNVVTPVGWVYPDPGNSRHQAVADAAERRNAVPTLSVPETMPSPGFTMSASLAAVARASPLPPARSAFNVRRGFLAQSDCCAFWLSHQSASDTSRSTKSHPAARTLSPKSE